MLTLADLDLDALASECSGRSGGSPFSLSENSLDALKSTVSDSAVLITGAAGFIAQATLKHVLRAGPRKVYLLDSSENGLADLARSLAFRQHELGNTQVEFILADITSPLLKRVIGSMDEVGLIAHFAAAKHVRSERDLGSALRMLDVNILGTHKLLELATEILSAPPIFAVSTDKAVEPSSLMGASKSIAEALLWSYSGRSTSARFANVLFSSGSLTETWLTRFSQNLPLSAPSNTRRFLVTPDEAGSICANAFVSPDKSLVVPAADVLTPQELVQVAERFLSFFGKQPLPMTIDEFELSSKPNSTFRSAQDSYPVILTPRDTVGEKAEEVFVRPMERVEEWSQGLQVVYPAEVPELNHLIASLSDLMMAPERPYDLKTLRELVASFVLDYRPSKATTSLDFRI